MLFIKKFITICLCLSQSLNSTAQIRLPQLIRDSMILQRDTKINIWGWASKDEHVQVKFKNKIYKSVANANGDWKLQLPATNAGGPYTMTIKGKNKIILHDILVGDVWVCSGQSNMVHQMKLHNALYEQEITQVDYPQVRQFWIPTMTDLQKPHNDLQSGNWKSANPHDILEFSAVAYFFAKKIHEKYKIPIGLINASVGGTPIEAWTSEEGLKKFPAILQTISKNKDTNYVNNITRKAMYEAANRPIPNDKGLTAPTPWYMSGYNLKDWRTISIPGYWEDQGIKDLNGIVWYRKEIEVPASMTGKPAKVILGRIVDADFLYINGKLVGNTSYMYPQRRYAVPENLLNPGKNLFVIRIINHTGKGGFVPDKPYYLTAGNDTIDLTGYWEYKVGDVFVPGGSNSGGLAIQNQPTALFNAMLAPVTNYTIRGFLWYQGESNLERATEYAKLQPAMIADWRSKWKQENLPFLYVQLPGFGDYNYLPTESQWALFREAQAASLSVPNTAMAVAIDLGEWNDIHPDRKKEIGDRLALAAEKLVYGSNSISAGPVLKSTTTKGNKMILSFINTGSGLKTTDGEDPREFAIAGGDKKFVWAQAKIEADKIFLFTKDLQKPKYVRYAWADNPVNLNLINSENLPAAPFRTDE